MERLPASNILTILQTQVVGTIAFKTVNTSNNIKRRTTSRRIRSKKDFSLSCCNGEESTTISALIDTNFSAALNSYVSGYKWVPYTGMRATIPGMICAGRDLDGANLVVGRANHNGDVLPAKVKPEHAVAYVAYGGAEHEKHHFEVSFLRPIDSRLSTMNGSRSTHYRKAN